jgi:hypothetical protein
MDTRKAWVERETVGHWFGWRVRLYVGHTNSQRARRVNRWRSDLGTRGVFVVLGADPEGRRVLGAQASPWS